MKGVTAPLDSPDTRCADPSGATGDRLAWEAKAISEARADVEAGRLTDASEVRAWVDSLRSDRPLPVPYARR